MIPPQTGAPVTQIIFTGDVAFSQHFAGAWRAPAADEAVLRFLQSAPHVVADIEGAVTDRPFAVDQWLMHASPACAAGALADMHLNVWDLANNHMLDCGPAGICDTLEAARAGGCVPLGVGETPDTPPRPLILGKAGCRVGILPVLDGWDEYAQSPQFLTLARPAQLRRALRALRAQCDYAVAVVHAGQEYTSMPLPPLRRAYRRLLAWGADVVVGHHPHVVQNYERVGRKVIFYSLGNFIFDTPTQRQFRYTDRSVLLRLTFSARGIAWTHLPCRIDRTRQCVCAESGAPPIFCALSRLDYALLWPLAAAVYRQNCRRKRRFFGGGAARPLWRRLLGKLRHACRRSAWEMLAGRALARLGVWRLSRKKRLAAYLLAGAPGHEEGNATWEDLYPNASGRP